jgi:hypothetical protein
VEYREDVQVDSYGSPHHGTAGRSARGVAGSVRATVDHLLGSAWDALWERKEQDADGILTAGAHVDAALVVLTAYRARLAALSEQDTKEHLETWANAQAKPSELSPRFGLVATGQAPARTGRTT